jgi:hypothetical protein
MAPGSLVFPLHETDLSRTPIVGSGGAVAGQCSGEEVAGVCGSSSQSNLV